MGCAGVGGGKAEDGMSGQSKIEWTDATWNPIRARLKQDTQIRILTDREKTIPAGTWGYHCERVSPGCKNCYACHINQRTLPAFGTGLDYTVPNREKVEIYLDEEELLKPLRWKKPRIVFPCSMTDLFAEFVPDEFIDQMFAVMALADQHTFQILTKRAGRMEAYLGDTVMRGVGLGHDLILRIAAITNKPPIEIRRAWPLPNVWLGVSVEDQKRKDRIEILRQTEAALRFVSLEPLLEDLGEVDVRGIHWAIVGGESGPGARPMDLVWVRSVRDQCAAAGVPLFVKQLGSAPHSIKDKISHRGNALPRPDGFYRYLRDRKGGDMEEWPEDLRVRQMPAVRAA